MPKKKNTTFKSVDKLSKELDIVDNFVLRNWKKYVYIALIVIIVFGGTLYIYEHRSQSNIEQSQEIYTAKTATELEQVINKYPESEAVNFSRLELGAQYFDKKDYKKAQEIYMEEINKGNSQFAVNLAKLNNCYVIEAMGNKTEAAENFEKLAENSSISEAIRAEAAYSSGRILIELGKKDEAVKVLKLCETFKGAKGWSKFAKGLLDENA